MKMKFHPSQIVKVGLHYLKLFLKKTILLPLWSKEKLKNWKTDDW